MKLSAKQSEVTADEHLAVLATAQRWVDSDVSKTCNVPANMPWHDFKNLYTKAWELGCKGITTFNPSGKRFGVLREATTCYIDEETSKRECE